MIWTANTFKIWELEVFPLKQGSGVDSVVNQKPEEDFVFQLNCTFPELFGESIGSVFSHEMLVNCGRGVNIFTMAQPNIFDVGTELQKLSNVLQLVPSFNK